MVRRWIVINIVICVYLDVKFVYPYNLGRVENMKQVLTFTCSPKVKTKVINVFFSGVIRGICFLGNFPKIVNDQ